MVGNVKNIYSGPTVKQFGKYKNLSITYYNMMSNDTYNHVTGMKQ